MTPTQTSMIASIYKITAPNGKSYIGQNLPGVHAKLKAKPGPLGERQARNCQKEQGKKISEHHKQALFEGHMVMPSWSGRRHTEKSKQKISTKLKGRSQPSEEQKMKNKQEAQGCVSLRKDSGKFQTIIPKSWNNGKKGSLGSFDTEEEAWVAIAEYKAEHVGS